MLLSELKEQSFDVIPKMIKNASEKLKTNFERGDCGTFAIALRKTIKKGDYVIIYSDDIDPEKFIHVLLKVDGKLYDGSTTDISKIKTEQWWKKKFSGYDDSYETDIKAEILNLGYDDNIEKAILKNTDADSPYSFSVKKIMNALKI